MASTLPNVDFPQARQQLNSSIVLLDSFNYGPEPVVKRACMPWIDSASGNFYIRSSDNNSWILQGNVSQPNFGLKAVNIGLDAIAGMVASQVQQAISELQAAKVSKQRPAWTNLVLQNGFSAFGSGTAVPAYRKLDSGEIQIKGLLTRPSGVPPIATIIAQLPVDYAPSEVIHVSTVGAGTESSGNVVGALFQVEGNGAIKYYGGACSIYYNLNCSYFQT